MKPQKIRVRIKRQDKPESNPYWQDFEIPYREKHNVVSLLMVIRENPVTVAGDRVAPPVWECNCLEEVCGACSMNVNGKPRQACAALVDQLDQPIVLEPLSKFPVVRDLLVDRQRMFDALLKIKAWVPIDGAYDVHRGAPRISPKEWEINYVFSRCMTCGCCMEACPQFHDQSSFIGPAPLGQVWLFNNHPTAGFFSQERLHSIMSDGGITDCGNAQNCVEVCPKEIPLTTAIADLGRQTTWQWLKDLFGK